MIRDFAPRGWFDAGLQFFLFFAVYQGYQVVRGLTDGNPEVAFANAQRVIDIEKGSGTFRPWVSVKPRCDSTLCDEMPTTVASRAPNASELSR